MEYHNPVLPQNIYIILSDCFPDKRIRRAKSALVHFILQNTMKSLRNVVSVSKVMYTYQGNKAIFTLAYSRIIDAEKPRLRANNILLYSEASRFSTVVT
jgi:hypothetical protein